MSRLNPRQDGDDLPSVDSCFVGPQCFAFIPRTKSITLSIFRGPKPQYPKNTAFTRTFSKTSRNFLMLSCDTSQEPHDNCSEKLVQMNHLLLFFRVDFLSPPRESCSKHWASNQAHTVLNYIAEELVHKSFLM